MLARGGALICMLATALTCVSVGPCSTLGLAASPGSGKADTAQIDVTRQVQRDAVSLPVEFTLRARVTALEPAGRVDLHWRYGGEAQGGAVVSGCLGSDLDVGQWTASAPLVSLAKNGFPPPFMKRMWFITFVAVAPEKKKASRNARPDFKNVQMEFEFSYKGQVVKTFQEAAPDGPTTGLAVPHYRLAAGRLPDDRAFLDELSGLLVYARRRVQHLESLPWHNESLPKKFMLVSDLSGYGTAGYGVRYSNRAIVEAECRTLRQMGVNSLRAAPAFLHEMARSKEGFAKDLGLGVIGTAMGLPVVGYRKDRESPGPEAGCPFGSQVPRLTAEAVKIALERNLAIPVQEVWALTVDEIGTVMDQTPEGKTHMNSCLRCGEAFRRYVQELGASPADFDQPDWANVKPAYGVENAPGATSYYSRKFNNYATAKLFAELRQAFDEANQAKQQALNEGQLSSPTARQPWIYSYALRGNTFLMGGHSLDFFDFYRFADNGFVYETSNTGAQIWQWDSYLCDVGRVVSTTMNKRFGIYIKPHRGAPVQRALSAISRNAKMIYWYTYGPDYFKGDSFADNLEAVTLAAKAAHLIGKCEDVLYGSSWGHPAEVAIVKPRCSEFLGNDAQWENAKWVYTALAHAHVPVDPIDEVLLAQMDLSRYKAIYVNGSHLPRRAAENLAKFVHQGGLLWTSGWGCARDEANRPLAALRDVLGLAERAAAPELWCQVERYRATAVQSFAESKAVLAPKPENAQIIGSGPYEAQFVPVVGREVLQPGPETRVLAKFADGGAAMTVHPYGKGQAYVVGFYPGLEYSATVRDGDWDMSQDFDPTRLSFIAAPALAVTLPTVETSVPAVEAVLLRNDVQGKKAVTLMNWTYRAGPQRQSPEGKKAPAFQIAALKNLKVSIRHAGQVTKAISASLDQVLPVSRRGDVLEVVLPLLVEGDVLILE